jgi:O-antigen ligase
MIGISGTIFFVWLIIQPVCRLWRQYKNNMSEIPFLYAMLGFVAIHMCSEGYILAAGSFLFFWAWLLLGTLQAYSKKDEMCTNE